MQCCIVVFDGLCDVVGVGVSDAIGRVSFLEDGNVDEVLVVLGLVADPLDGVGPAGALDEGSGFAGEAAEDVQIADCLREGDGVCESEDLREETSSLWATCATSMWPVHPHARAAGGEREARKRRRRERMDIN